MGKPPLWRAAALAARSALLGVPEMAALFLLFPRFGPLWGLPQDAGGRTGLTAVVVAVLFLAAIFLAPLASIIAPYATGPALVFVGCVMLAGLADVDWDDVTAFVPAAITAAAMPLTYSIATGVGIGFITYTGLKLLSGRWREASPTIVILSVLFLLKFIFVREG